jgi:hypothetical protein
VPALDLPLSLRMIRCTADVLHTLFFKSVGQFTGDVTRPIVGQQARPLVHRCLVAA